MLTDKHYFQSLHFMIENVLTCEKFRGFDLPYFPMLTIGTKPRASVIR